MKEAGIPDSLTVVNGPEDGTEFSLTRSPFTIGHDASCTVCLRLDNDIEKIHVRVTAAGDGYRVRCATGKPVEVNDRRAGKIRSRILRSGQFLKVGHTELVLECAPDGLAGRSRGIVHESDWAWAFRTAVSGSFALVRGLVRASAALLRWLRRRKQAVAAALFVVLYFFVPSFRTLVLYWAGRALELFRMLRLELFG